MSDRQQVQFNRKAGETPQSKPADPPVVLPAPKDRFDNALPSFVNCLAAFGRDLLSKIADLYVVRSYLNAAQSLLVISAFSSKGTTITIGAAINLF